MRIHPTDQRGPAGHDESVAALRVPQQLTASLLHIDAARRLLSSKVLMENTINAVGDKSAAQNRLYRSDRAGRAADRAHRAAGGPSPDTPAAAGGTALRRGRGAEMRVSSARSPLEAHPRRPAVVGPAVPAGAGRGNRHHVLILTNTGLHHVHSFRSSRVLNVHVTAAPAASGSQLCHMLQPAQFNTPIEDAA